MIIGAVATLWDCGLVRFRRIQMKSLVPHAMSLVQAPIRTSSESHRLIEFGSYVTL